MAEAGRDLWKSSVQFLLLKVGPAWLLRVEYTLLLTSPAMETLQPLQAIFTSVQPLLW